MDRNATNQFSGSSSTSASSSFAPALSPTGPAPNRDPSAEELPKPNPGICVAPVSAVKSLLLFLLPERDVADEIVDGRAGPDAAGGAAVAVEDSDGGGAGADRGRPNAGDAALHRVGGGAEDASGEAGIGPAAAASSARP